MSLGRKHQLMKLKKNLIIGLFLFAGRTAAIAQVTQIPFEFNGKHMYFNLKYNIKDSLHFIFDTGATNATIDSATAEKSGINKTDRKTVSMGGSGGSQSYSMVGNQTLKPNGLEIKDVNLIMVNFSSLSKDLGSQVDGVIGYEILSKYTTKLDFERKQIVLY